MSRRRALPGLMALALLLTGCSAMLEGRGYQSVSPHVRVSVAEDDSSAVWVETYSELQSALLAQVKACQEVGIIRLRNWQADVEDALSRACDEVSHDDPLGAYAVDRIQHTYVRMVTYYEATVTIDYRRSAEQIAAVTTVTGSGAIRAELVDALDAFLTETAFQVNYFDGSMDDAYLQALAREAYYDLPAAALGMPEVHMELYPSSGGSRRVVEVFFTYPEDPAVLAARRVQLEAAALDLMGALEDGPGPEELFHALRAHAQPAEEGATAYHALVEGAADSQGMALAYKLLCDLAGVECQVVEGTLGDAPRFWTIVAWGGGRRHVDPSWEEGLLLSDGALAGAGYGWDAEAYPPAGRAEGGHWPPEKAFPLGGKVAGRRLDG